MRFSLSICLLLLFYYQANSQNNFIVTGKIFDNNNQLLSSAIITLKNQGKTFYAISDNYGVFELKGTPFNDSIVFRFSVKLIGYRNFDSSFYVRNTSFNLGNILLHEEYTTLNQVLVKNQPIVVNGDTTTLDVKSFSNKLDNSLEDVLKKMPGFDLNSSGDISFNGKPIQNIFIEGDELTKNYKQISKNIGPDLIDKVQMIDKYNSNPALKGLINSGNQVMNLKLKNPKKLKAFGTAKVGAGVKDKQEFAANFFILKSKFKSLIIASKNNIGESPYKEITSNGDNSLVQEYDFDPTYTPQYIQQDLLFNKPFFSNNSNTLFNHSNLAVANNIFKLNKHADIKLFSDLYDDKIFQFKNSHISNLISPSLSYNENVSKIFRPFYFNNYLQLNNTTKKSRLLVAAGFQSKKYREEQQINAPIKYSYSIDKLFSRYSGGIFYTHRIDSLHAYEILLQNNNDRSIENGKIFQNISRTLDSVYTSIGQEQHLKSQINYNKILLKYIMKGKNNMLSTFRLQNTNILSGLNSRLSFIDSSGYTNNPDLYRNNNILRSNELQLTYSSSIAYKKINISFDAGVSYYRQYIDSKQSAIPILQRQFYITPGINLTYNFKKVNFLSGNFGLTNEVPDLSMQALNPVLSNYRNVINNINTSDKINSFKANVIYSYRDFNKGKNLLFSWFHLSKFKGVISDNIYGQDFDYYHKFFNQKAQTLDNFILNVDRYFDKGRIGFNLKNNILLYSNPLISEGMIAFRKYFSYSGSFGIRPSFKKNINSNFGLELNFNKDLNSKTSTFNFSPFVSLATSFSKNLSAGTKLNLYKTNFFENKQNYFLGDLFLIYNLPKTRATLKFNLINFTNTHEVYSGYKNIFQEKSVISQNLPRYFLVEFKYNFK